MINVICYRNYISRLCRRGSSAPRPALPKVPASASNANTQCCERWLWNRVSCWCHRSLSIGNVHSNKKWLWNWPLEQAVIHVTCFSFPQILEKIANYKVVIIEGETGCGKSTQVPQFILDECVDKHKHCNIVVTQPRKIAATSLARRVCRERGWQLGKLVGYQVGQFSGAIRVAVLHLILTIKNQYFLYK